MDGMQETLEEFREQLRAYVRRPAETRPQAGNRSVRLIGQQAQRSDDADDKWLITWGEVAWHLGVSEDSAQRYARREVDPLPVVRLGGRISAKISELDAWRQNQPRWRRREN